MASPAPGNFLNYFKPDFFESAYITTIEFKYNEVPEDAKDNLTRLIDNLATVTIMSIPLKVSEIIEQGKKINSIHPLNTIELLLLNEKLKSQLKIIFDEARCTFSLFKNPYGLFYNAIREQFTAGFCHFLQLRHRKDEIIPNLDSFCEKTHIEKDELLPFIDREDWKGFVQKIILRP